MGLTSGLASRDDVPVYPVVAAGGRSALAALRLTSGVEVVDTPRAAALLVVLGRLTRGLVRPLLVVHDQLPTPRATVRWGAGPDDLLRTVLPAAVELPTGDGSGLRQIFADVITGRRPSDPPAQLDIEPNPWRGLGPYGTGGTGMTGGVPYGRPLASRAPDPDGLELDHLPIEVGPLFAPLPPGLVLRLDVQGDVVRSAEVGPNPFRVWPGDAPPGPLDPAIFHEALQRPVTVAELELARARHHLGAVADAVHLLGLGALATRLRRTAKGVAPDADSAARSVIRRVRRSRSLRAALAGVGPMGDDPPPGLVARAAGADADARAGDPAYVGLDFTAVVGERDDAWGRLVQRLDEAEQALELIRRAGARVREPGSPMEGPRGPMTVDDPAPSALLTARLPALLEGQEWGDAFATIVSLDLDLEEAAQLAPAVPA